MMSFAKETLPTSRQTKDSLPCRPRRCTSPSRNGVRHDVVPSYHDIIENTSVTASDDGSLSSFTMSSQGSIATSVDSRNSLPSLPLFLPSSRRKTMPPTSVTISRSSSTESSDRWCSAEKGACQPPTSPRSKCTRRATSTGGTNPDWELPCPEELRQETSSREIYGYGDARPDSALRRTTTSMEAKTSLEYSTTPESDALLFAKKMMKSMDQQYKNSIPPGTSRWTPSSGTTTAAANSQASQPSHSGGWSVSSASAPSTDGPSYKDYYGYEDMDMDRSSPHDKNNNCSPTPGQGQTSVDYGYGSSSNSSSSPLPSASSNRGRSHRRGGAYGRLEDQQGGGRPSPTNSRPPRRPPVLSSTSTNNKSPSSTSRSRKSGRMGRRGSAYGRLENIAPVLNSIPEDAQAVHHDDDAASVSRSVGMIMSLRHQCSSKKKNRSSSSNGSNSGNNSKKRSSPSGLGTGRMNRRGSACGRLEGSLKCPSGVTAPRLPMRLAQEI